MHAVGAVPLKLVVLSQGRNPQLPVALACVVLVALNAAEEQVRAALRTAVCRPVIAIAIALVISHCSATS